MSFGDYLNPGVAYTKMSQIGVIPRPAGLPLPHFAMRLHGELHEPKVRSYQDGFCKFHKSRPKGMNQVRLIPNPVITRRIRVQFNLRSNMGQVINKLVQHEAEPSQSQADRPRRGRPASNYLRWSHATATDLRRESRASTQRRWPDGSIPKLASIGEAGRPHLAASEAPSWRGRQA